MIVSDNEERYLEKMEEQWRKELEKDASGTKEEDAVANDVSESRWWKMKWKSSKFVTSLCRGVVAVAKRGLLVMVLEGWTMTEG